MLSGAVGFKEYLPNVLLGSFPRSANKSGEHQREYSGYKSVSLGGKKLHFLYFKTHPGGRSVRRSSETGGRNRTHTGKANQRYLCAERHG